MCPPRLPILVSDGEGAKGGYRPLLASVLFLILGVSYGKKCHFPKELILTQNLKVNLNTSNMAFINAAEDDIRLRSLSPWNYRRDEDKNRHPPVIHEAICSHAWCLDSEGNKDVSKNSVPITQNILVLRWVVTNCHQNFRLEYQLVTVGCTCSKPITHVVS
ncbi:interleukin-17A-like [Rhinoderma darwinii]|uniref:interleukin-17A-like n=1 Tax=Rhinoderma darwinii TaxID=43563 RepID=UPI003F681F9A